MYSYQSEIRETPKVDGDKTFNKINKNAVVLDKPLIINKMITTFLLLLLGVIVGILGAILGIGGGIVMVPVLTFLFDMPVHNAIAVSLVL